MRIRKEEIGKLEGMKVGMLGDLRNGRTVHSLSQALDRFKTQFFFVSPDSLAMPEHITDELKELLFRFQTPCELWLNNWITLVFSMVKN